MRVFVTEPPAARLIAALTMASESHAGGQHPRQESEPVPPLLEVGGKEEHAPARAPLVRAGGEDLKEEHCLLAEAAHPGQWRRSADQIRRRWTPRPGPLARDGDGGDGD